MDVDGKETFYRVQIPVGEMSEAASFCKRCKAAGGSCFVTR
ncbi:MAG: SPOR domain-containing protein [Hyphomicrobiales bacterium]|nr:SPOR domain-containing protein [Hyphomicrobiales bacterium]